MIQKRDIKEINMRKREYSNSMCAYIVTSPSLGCHAEELGDGGLLGFCCCLVLLARPVVAVAKGIALHC